MSRICQSCGKGAQKAANRSHSNVKTLRRQEVNLQKVNGTVMCTKCVRTVSKQSKN